MDQHDRNDWTLFQRGNPAGMERIYNRHRNAMYTYCLYMTGHRQTAEDLLQETFARLMGQKDCGGEIRSLKNWLFICARNLTLNHLKRECRAESLDWDPVSEIPEVGPEVRLFIERILGGLSAEDRELILLREQQRFSIEELADLLGVSSEAVRVRLYRARRRMQKLAKGSNDA